MIEVNSMTKQFIIDEELANKILQHLSMQPFCEVADMCNGLLRLKEIPQVGSEPVSPTVK